MQYSDGIAAAADDAAAPAHAVAASAGSTLVVDDDRDSLVALVRLLELNGHRAIGASGYREAIELWNVHRCRTLIADIALPDGSGLDLMRELHPQGVRGIAVSGNTTRADVQASLRAGYAAHLFKPIIFAELLATLDDMRLPPPTTPPLSPSPPPPPSDLTAPPPAADRPHAARD
jgi:CheY-like chemotaxis protein